MNKIDVLGFMDRFGVVTTVGVVLLVVLAWLLRISLRNPLEAVSSALHDVELARKALADELEKARKTIETQEQTITTQQRYIADLEARIAQLELISTGGADLHVG